MVFWILFTASCAFIVLPVLALPFALLAKDFDLMWAAFGVGIAVAIIPGVIAASVWGCHADDLGTIVAQQEVISVYEKQRDDLNKTMASFDYPAATLLNADSPVRSIVEQLGNVEKLLAEARAERAEAIKSIEQRRVGPVSGVISFVGDYK